jgi:hypothetical protein
MRRFANPHFPEIFRSQVENNQKGHFGFYTDENRIFQESRLLRIGLFETDLRTEDARIRASRDYPRRASRICAK